MTRRWPVLALFGLLLVAPGVRAETMAPAPASFAVRAGWAYGLGAELEYRPGSWGIGISGGYVPRLGAGGYVGVQWGARPLDAAGPVAEAGLFRGVHNPLRAAPTGLGLHALAGYAWVPTGRLSVRVVAGGGVPFAPVEGRPSFEFLAKLTAGLVF